MVHVRSANYSYCANAIGYLIGFICEWLIDTDAYDLGKHAAVMIDLFFAGLLARPALRDEPLA